MNEVVSEFLKISFGVLVGGALSTPFKVLTAYNSSQVTIESLERKFENLSEMLGRIETMLIESKVKTEVIENSLRALDRRVGCLESSLEFLLATRQKTEPSVE